MKLSPELLVEIKESLKARIHPISMLCFYDLTAGRLGVISFTPCTPIVSQLLVSETRKEVGLKLSRRDKGGERTRENVDLGVFVGWESLERSQSACQRDKYTMSSTEKQRELQSDWLATPMEIESYPINQSHGNDETGADRVSAHGRRAVEVSVPPVWAGGTAVGVAKTPIQ
ncbi:hypothetical protein RRG08_054620 [Elysia crispata]|uniref:Uncharacterized protein n=1 Tax=Elysia crispata TaxID=231223 RepID=A0AAE1B304_9GAST|nr:hypothetical protein RRG08_054620 [Elysia crispata]